MKHDDLIEKRDDIIDRILKLSDEQFEQFLTLYSRQDAEFDPLYQAPHRTSA